MPVPSRGRVERKLRSWLTDAPAGPDVEREALQRRIESLEVQVAALEQELDLTRLDPTRWPIRHYVDNRGLTVRAGPFAGLTFPADVVGHPELADSLAAKLIGCYERELHPSIERALERRPAAFVNIGAGDGYYAVGLALRSPDAVVHAFDSDEGRRATCEALADLNSVAERVEVHGRCDTAWLAQLPDDAFLLVDCEGCEVDLLDPEQAPSLRQATLIVELHDFIDPRSSRRIVERFGATHEIERVPAEPRHVDEFEDLEFLGWKQREIAVGEFRFRPMEWAVLTLPGRE
jgi:hypothetical protein